MTSKEIQLMMRLEGFHTRAYRDHLGNNTVGIGFNMDSKPAQAIFESVVKEVGWKEVYDNHSLITLNDAINLCSVFWKDASRQVKQRLEEMSIATELEEMSEFKQFILKDIVYNTGSISGWSKVLKAKDDLVVMYEARRKQTELDSRIAKAAFFFGVIETVEEAIEAGLTEAKYIR